MAKKKCGSCQGNGGWWVMDDGKKAGKQRWKSCSACNGSGTV